MDRKEFEELLKCEAFRVLWDRLMDRFDALEEKIDRLTKRHNCLDGDQLLDTQDLCLLLKVSKRSLQRYRKNGVLPFHTMEGKVFYKSSDIHEFIRHSFNPSRKNPPENEPI